MQIIKLTTTFIVCFVSFFGVVAQNHPPKIIATGHQPYCPQSEIPIVESFNIVNTENNEINAFYIQISSGYVYGEDVLELSKNYQNIVSSWNAKEGKLILKSTSGNFVLSELIEAVKSVVFKSSALDISIDKGFSLTLGAVNYLPSTDHYYEYVPDVGITWKEARTAAESRRYYGLKGYLATITSSDEAKLSGEQAAGAGWIGGSDEETEGVWKWVTGPEAGTIFWRGGINGSTPNFAFWNTQEPNNLGDEDYAHVTAPGVGINGSWNDLSNQGGTSGDYQPKGYMVEYGGSPGDPDLNLSASTTIYIPKITSITEASHCGPGVATLVAQASHGEVLWFETADAITPIAQGIQFTTPLLDQSKSYYVLASEYNCISGIKTEVKASIYDIPVTLPEYTLKNCDEDGVADGFTDFNLQEADLFITEGDLNLVVSYYLSAIEAEQKTNELNPFPFSNKTSSLVYARSENNDGCFTISKVFLEVSTTSLPDHYLKIETVCEQDDLNDGIMTFDLTILANKIIQDLPQQDLSVHFYHNFNEAQLEQNEILPQNNYRNTIPSQEILYVRIESNLNGDCYGIGPYVQLNVLLRPEFEVKPNDIVCLNLEPIELQTIYPQGQYTYEWTDSSGVILGNDSTLKVDKGGIYNVKAFSPTSCESFIKSITVKESIIANLSSDGISVTDNSENNTIVINTSNLGIGDYEYALDYSSFQDDPIFEYVPAGLHHVYVRDKNGCGTAQVEVSIIGYPKFFTPNNDGFNDTWQVEGITAQPKSKIYIFDRFGRLITQILTDSEGWDGRLNGKVLPSSDYWYLAELEDGRTHKGHFSLIK